jgi:hypothetical protein
MMGSQEINRGLSPISHYFPMGAVTGAIQIAVG